MTHIGMFDVMKTSVELIKLNLHPNLPITADSYQNIFVMIT